ncbi:MAG: 5-methyltetrahydropteroyltriglutamate--homocysteine S-methyltransferase, partial [bacterium]
MGSFLRPKEVLDARAQRDQGKISAEQLRTVENDAIAKLVKQQEEHGIEAITDGEFRREMFHVDFLKNLQGVVVR